MKLWTAIAVLSSMALGQTPRNHGVTLAVHVLVPCGKETGAAVQVAESATRLCRERTPFLTQDDVEAAEIQNNSKGSPRVFLTFRDEAARRELQVTRQNIGNRVAIVVNGRVVATPMVSGASRLLYIDGDYTREQAETLVMAFNRTIQARKGPK